MTPKQPRSAENGPNTVAVGRMLGSLGSDEDAMEAPWRAALRSLAAAVDRHPDWSRLWREYRLTLTAYANRVNASDEFDASEIFGEL